MSARRGLFQRFRTVDRIGSRSRRRRLDTKGRKLNLESLEARTLLSATIWVDDDNISGIEDGSSAYPYNTIQEGISAVDAGGTVNVAAGTYTRTGAGSSVVDINKSVNLRGANADVLPGAARGPESVIDGNSAGENYYVVQISANDATLNGFSITNPLYNSTADAAGVTITSARYSNLRVAYNIIHDIGTPTRSPADFGTFGLNVGPVDGLQIDHNEIYNIANGDLDQRSIGIFTWGNDETDNTHNLLIADNNVHDITAAPAASYGIYTGFFGDGIAVSGNTLTNTGRYGISTNEWGLSPVSITDNAITGAADAGIRIRSVWSDTVSGNSVTGNSTGMLVQDVATAAPAVHNNDLSDNSSFGLNNLSAVTVDATANWWGDASGPFHATGNPAGTGSPVSDHVSFDPWVGKSTDGDNAVVDPDIEQWLFNEIVEDAGAGNDIVTTTIGSQAELGSFIALVESLPDQSNPVTIELNVAGGPYDGLDLDVPMNVTFLINLGGGTLGGGSPALTVGSGQVIVANGTLTQSGAGSDPGQGDFPTVLVENGGSLTLGHATLGGATINESDSYDQVAVKVDAGGSLAFQSAVTNTINIVGAGRLIDYFDNDPVNAVGTVFQQDGVAIPSNFAIEDFISHALDNVAYGLVTWVSGNVYVTTNTLGIQRGVNAASSGDTVNVKTGSYTGNVSTAGKSVALAPGSSPGQVAITGDLTFDSDDTYPVELNGTNPATEYDNFIVSGAVTLGDATLSASLGFAPPGGTTFTIVDKTLPGAISGTFNGIAESHVVTIGGDEYQVTYLGGDGNDVVLNYIDPANPIFNGTPGSDSFTVKRNGAALEVYLGVDLIDSRDYSSVTTLVFNGGAGDDTLTLDFNDGNPLPSGELTFNGGGDSDSLILQGGTTATITHTFTSPSEGSIVLDGALSGTINYTGLEPVIDNLGAVNRIFTFTGAAETITLDAGGTLDNQIDSTLGESVDFTNPSNSLTINLEASGGSGADAANVEGLDAGFNADLTVNGGNDDTVTFQTAATGLTSGNLSVNAGTIDVNRPITTNGTVSLVANNDITFGDDGPGSGSIATNSASSVAVWLESDSGAIVDGTAGEATLVSASNGRLVISSTTGAGSADELEIDVAQLYAVNATSGNIDLSEADSVEVTHLFNSVANDADPLSGSVRLVAGGTITVGTAGVGTIDGNVTLDASGPNADVVVNVGISASHTGAVSISADRSILMTPGTSVGVVDGNLTMNADGAPAGNYVAIDLNGATLTSSGAGNIALTGVSGGLASTSGNVGIRLRNSAVVQSNGTGTITLDGTGGIGSSNNYGVNVDGLGSKVTSATGDIEITGFGGDGTDAYNVGIMLYPSGQVISTGTAKVSLDGTAGAGTYGNYGVDLESAAKVSSAGGDISVVGQGGAGTANYNVGVDLYASSEITATGSAKITITGTGGTGTDDNHGVRLTSSSISSATGDIELNGTATDATGSNQHGIWFDNSSLSTTGAAGVTLTGTAGNAGSFGIDLVNSTSMSLAGAGNTLVADSMNLATPAGAINAGANAVTLRQETASTAINLGGADAAGTLGLTDGELDCIAAATINVGDGNSGTLTVSAAITRSTPTAMNLTSGADIAFSGLGSLDSAGGNVTLTAGTAGAITSGAAATDITAGAGTVSLNAGSGGIGASGNPLAVGGANLDAATGGNANQFLSASGAISIDAADLNAGAGTIELDGGTFLTTPTGWILSPVVVESGATLGGTGTVSATVTVKSGGTVAPGTSPGVLNTGDVAFEPGSTFSVEINGPTAGEGAGFHDQLNVTGTVNLGSATLDVSTLAPYSPPDEHVFVIIANDGDGTTGDAVAGTFAGLPDGGWVQSGSQLYKISYHGGDGNDVTLMAVDILGQYASRVIDFSSQYSGARWSAEQTLWEPNVAAYGDQPNAWAPFPKNGTTESITLGYDTPVFATGFSIWENFGNGFVTKVEFLDTTEVPHTVWESAPDPTDGTHVVAEFAQNFLPTSYLVHAIRITVDTDHNLSTWEEIDAVQLRGVPAKDGILVTVTPTSGLVTSEAGGTATFTVVLQKPPTADVTIGLSSSDTTEGIVLLPDPPSLVFSPANWNVPQTVTVKGVSDLMTDGNVPYTIVTAPAVSADLNFNGVDAADVSVTNLDNWVQEYASSVTGFSSQYSSTNWSAARALGEPDVALYGDYPNAWAPRSANGGAEFLTVGFAIPLHATGVVIRESFGNGFVTKVEVHRTDLDEFVTVWSGVDPTLPGAPADFAIPPFGPTSYLVDQVRITIDKNHSSSWEEIDAVGLLGIPATGWVIVEPTSGLVTTEGGGTATFAVVLGVAPTADVVIDLSSSDLGEGTVSPANLTFTPANWDQPQIVTVTGVDDLVADGSVAYTVLTSVDAGSDPNFVGVDVPDVSVTNLDNEAAPLAQYASSVIAFSSQYSGDRWSAAQALGAPNATYGDDPNAWAPSPMNGTTEWLTLGFATPVFANRVGIWENWGNGFVTKVEVRKAGTQEFEEVWSGADTTGPGASPSPNFDISFAQRTYLVDAVRITVDTNHSVNGWEEIDAVQLEGTQSAAQIIVSPTSGLVTTEAGGTATFTVVLSTQPTANVTIGLSSSNTAEGTVSPASLVFTSANWNTPQTVTVTGVDDHVIDPDQPYTIVTAPAVSGDPNFNGINPADVSVTNLGNGSAPPPTTQYATSVIGFSSQYSSTRWSAAQALGAPNVSDYGDYPNAWAPLPRNGTTEWLALGFTTPVQAKGVVIRESWGNGFVTKVEVREQATGTFYEVWSGVDTTSPGAPADFAVHFSLTSYLVDAVKIWVDTNHSGDWEEIDAVQLLDDPPGSTLLAVIGDQVVDEQGTLSFTASAAGQVPPAPAMTYGFSAASQALREDPPVPALTYSLDAASYDLGMRIDPATGAFRWTPARGQSGKYSATIMVRDDVSDPSHPLASETIAITVGDVVNLPSGKIGGLVLRRNGDNLELVGASYSKQTYWTAPAQEVFKLTIRGRANAADTLTVDYTNGPLDIENGVVFDAKNGAAADTLVIKGAPGDDAVEIAAGRVVFNGTQYTLRGVENVTVDTGRGNDTVAIAGLGANVTWIDSAGTDLLNFSQAAGSLNLNLDVPSRQRIFAGNSRTLTLRTIVEDVIGTAQADLIKGNKAANRIDGGGGNDTLYGNAGNDVLNGGDGDDWLYGDAGEDTLVGEAGNNVLLGGDGNDVLDAVTGVRTDVVGKNLLIGGKGADTFQGGIGEELLIGGTTNYDNNAKALAAVMRAWATDKTFEQRCSLLEKGSTDPTAGFIQVKPRSKSSTRGTVLDDSARDLLYGRSDPDWFFGFGKDETDRGAADR